MTERTARVIQTLWPIAGGIVLVVVSFATTGNTAASAQEGVDALRVEVESIKKESSADRASIAAALASLKAGSDATQQRLDRIERKLDAR